MQVAGEVFERIPLFSHLKARSQVVSTGELFVDNGHRRLLITAMDNKLSAQHVDIWIAMAACLGLVAIAGAMESVRRAMEANISLSIFYSIEECGLPGLSHRFATIGCFRVG